MPSCCQGTSVDGAVVTALLGLDGIFTIKQEQTTALKVSSVEKMFSLNSPLALEGNLELLLNGSTSSKKKYLDGPV